MAEIWYVDPDASGVGDGTSRADAFPSIVDWESSVQKPLVDDVIVYCSSSAGSPDSLTSSINISGWSNANNFTITVAGDPGVPSGIYQGNAVYSNSHYRIESTAQLAFTISESDPNWVNGVHVQDIQIKHTYTGANGSVFGFSSLGGDNYGSGGKLRRVRAWSLFDGGFMPNLFGIVSEVNGCVYYGGENTGGNSGSGVVLYGLGTAADNNTTLIANNTIMIEGSGVDRFPIRVDTATATWTVRVKNNFLISRSTDEAFRSGSPGPTYDVSHNAGTDPTPDGNLNNNYVYTNRTQLGLYLTDPLGTGGNDATDCDWQLVPLTGLDGGGTSGTGYPLAEDVAGTAPTAPYDIGGFNIAGAAPGVSGSFDVTEAPDTVALTGTVVAPTVVAGSFSVTEAPDVAALTGLVVVSGVASGAFNVTEAPDVVALAGTVVEGESGIINPDLTFWWYPRADANDTPDTDGLITRPVNGEPGFTFEFGGVGGGSYRDSAGVIQTLPGSPTGDDIPRWDHRAASPHESLGLLVERNQVEWARRINPSFGYVEAEGIFYVDIYYDAPRPAGPPHGIYLFLSTDPDNLITLNLNSGGGGGTLPTSQSVWGQIRASAQDQIMTFANPVNVAAGGRFRMAIGWTNVAAPADGTIMMYAGQQEDLAGIPVDWGNGLGLGVKIGEYNDTMDNVPITASTRLMIPGNDSEVSGAAREARVHVLEARYYNRWLGETFLRELTSGNVNEGDLPEPPALTNAYQMLV